MSLGKPKRSGRVCMICGRSLATLSTAGSIDQIAYRCAKCGAWICNFCAPDSTCVKCGESLFVRVERL